jgi:hypothetical protein
MRDDNETPTAADQGFSLIDVIVATSIMSVVMVMVTGAIIEIYSNVDRIDSVSAARDQIGNSFRRLDKELRYATWVSTPGKVGDAWYVEFATDTNCQQLVFADGKLTRSTWTSSPTPAVGPAIPIAGELTLTGTTPPFTVYAPGDKPYASAGPNVSGVGRGYELEHTQVRLRFSGTVGTTSLPLDMLFTAQNTNRNTSAVSDCRYGRPTG